MEALVLVVAASWAPHTAPAGARREAALGGARSALRMSAPDVALAGASAGVGDIALLAVALHKLDGEPLSLAQLTDAIDASPAASGDALSAAADLLRRLRRKQLLADLLMRDRAAYLETVSFLPIPRRELPNRQDVPVRACDVQPAAAGADTDADADAADGGGGGEALVPDCELPDVAMGENVLEAAILSITRRLYDAQTGGGSSRVEEGGIRGLLAEMRTFMLSPQGSSPAAQQQAIVTTLYGLMTPVLPPFYRIFMGGIVPSAERGDPRWLVDAAQWVATRLPPTPLLAEPKAALTPGSQLGPLPYAPLLTSVVAPYAFGFLVGPAQLTLRADGGYGGLVVEKCKFLQESGCKGMCLNSCKLPAQTLFDELGLSLRVLPNFETQECQWSFGEPAPPPEDDPTWPKGCLTGCSSREAMRELGGAAAGVPACE